MGKLLYAKAVAEKLAELKLSDPQLYSAVEEQLQGVRDHPDTHGSSALGAMRAKSFPVYGRDEEYVITWEKIDGRVRVIEFESVEVLLRLAQINKNRRT